jgi:SEC-C motif-containing protein
MRSRFSAYATGAIDYLIETTHSSTRKRFSRKDIEDWSRSNKWLKLEVLKTTESTVEFKAYYVHGLSPIQVHHERSNFKKEDGRWYYVDAF